MSAVAVAGKSCFDTQHEYHLLGTARRSRLVYNAFVFRRGFTQRHAVPRPYNKNSLEHHLDQGSRERADVPRPTTPLFIVIAAAHASLPVIPPSVLLGRARLVVVVVAHGAPFRVVGSAAHAPGSHQTPRPVTPAFLPTVAAAGAAALGLLLRRARLLWGRGDDIPHTANEDVALGRVDVDRAEGEVSGWGNFGQQGGFEKERYRDRRRVKTDRRISVKTCV